MRRGILKFLMFLPVWAAKDEVERTKRGIIRGYGRPGFQDFSSGVRSF